MERQPGVPVPFGDDGPIELPPPEETRPGPEERTGRLSGFGKFTKGVLPEILRGAMVGASSNGGENARGVLGAMNAVAEDRQNRDALQMQMRRQAEQDAMKQAEFQDRRQLHGAQMRNYDAQARERGARADSLATTKAAKPTQNEVFQGFLKQMMEAKDADGEPLYTPEEAQNRAAALTNRNAFLWLEGTPRTAVAGLERDTRLLNEGKISQEEFDQRQASRKKEVGGQAESTAGGTAKGKFANTPIKGKLVPTREGLREYIPKQMLPSGKEYSPSSMSEQPLAQPPAPRPRQPAELNPNATPQVNARVNALVNRVLADDKRGGGNGPVSALKNVMESYQNDPEISQHRAEIIDRLQKLIRGAATKKQRSAAGSAYDAVPVPASMGGTSKAPSDPLKLR
jgi:hypothetical protein